MSYLTIILLDSTVSVRYLWSSEYLWKCSWNDLCRINTNAIGCSNKWNTLFCMFLFGYEFLCWQTLSNRYDIVFKFDDFIWSISSSYNDSTNTVYSSCINSMIYYIPFFLIIKRNRSIKTFSWSPFFLFLHFLDEKKTRIKSLETNCQYYAC